LSPHGLPSLFFAQRGSFRIVYSISFMAKDADGTSVQKFTEIHVNTFQKLIRVLSIKKKNFLKKKMKNSEKKK